MSSDSPRPSPNLILGIDPGFTGALAIINPTSQPNKLIGVWDMPIQMIRERQHVDAPALSMLIDRYANEIRFAIMEDVGAMIYTDKHGERRGQGASASFAFGKSAGVVQGVLAAAYIPIIPIKPSVWKILMGLNANKETSRARASSLFPADKEKWARKKDDGRAEAILLAVFGADRFRNTNLRG